MGIQVGDNFDHKSKKPLDGRTQYATLADMKAVTDANIPEGCEAYCIATDTYYQFKSTNTVDADTGKWRERQSGGGGTSDYSDLSNKPQINGHTLSGNQSSSDLGLAPSDVTNTCYKTGDTAFTALADADYIPVYDTSASAKKKTLWSNIKSVLKTYFDTLYVLTAGTGLSKSSSTMSIKAFESGDMDEVISELPLVAGGKTHVYSTEEQVVGQWIDGSTIYQRTFQDEVGQTTTAGQKTLITLRTMTGCRIIHITACLKGNIALPVVNENGYEVKVVGSDTNVNLFTTQGMSASIVITYTVQYIKTT